MAAVGSLMSDIGRLETSADGGFGNKSDIRRWRQDAGLLDPPKSRGPRHRARLGETKPLRQGVKRKGASDTHAGLWVNGDQTSGASASWPLGEGQVGKTMRCAANGCKAESGRGVSDGWVNEGLCRVGRIDCL